LTFSTRKPAFDFVTDSRPKVIEAVNHLAEVWRDPAPWAEVFLVGSMIDL